MSTRCDIIIKDDKVSGKRIKLFHRQDGYPKGVGKFLVENILKEMKAKPNFGVIEVANFLVKNREDEDYLITDGTHPDIEYRYIVNTGTKEIKCQKVHYEQVDNHFELTVDRDIDLEKEV